MDHIFHLEEWIYLFNESLRIDVRFLFGLGAPVGWSDLTGRRWIKVRFYALDLA